MNQVTRNSSNSPPTIADTGATDHFFDKMIHSAVPIKNITPTTTGVEVVLPNSQTMKATHTAKMDIPELPRRARREGRESEFSLARQEFVRVA